MGGDAVSIAHFEWFGGRPASVVFQEHHDRMVDHFVWLFGFDPDYARYACGEYVEAKGCPFPKIGHAVKAALNARTEPVETS